ncbi:hypothetical protein B6I21_00540 [candidate division KSB1 bacterium 4572_119]|nr:MAG: hypothetical protein B6I21_00540 [candidate division KSB1 bacterium 4572_119]
MVKENKRILIADDEEAIVFGLTEMLEEEGYSISSALDGKAALDLLRQEKFALLLADLEMPKYDGMQLLKKIKKEGIETQVIIITGKGTISTAVRAMREGVYDYIEKPIKPIRLKSIIPKALEHYKLRVSHKNLEQQIKHLTHFEDIIGQSQLMLEVYKIIDAVADTTANVMITGESGTGKELVAKAIHRKSSRKNEPFIAVNCSAFPENILENELFGHEKGAFTGALTEKPGCFEMAHKGTLFLDEIGEMAFETQAKILRALEEKRFRRLGGKKEIEVDVRIVAATNRNLNDALKEKKLREDLYYRLCVMEIDLPPLKERLEDIPLLIDEFVLFFNQKNNKKIKGLTQRCMSRLMRYQWPGNVRELKNAIERAVILTTSSKIDLDVIPNRIISSEEPAKMAKPSEIEGDSASMIVIPVGTTMEEVEKKVILRTLEKANQNKTKAARILGISLKTIHNKLGKFDAPKSD